MHPTEQGNTQVYSPLGSYVVEQHNEHGRYDTLKQHYQGESYHSQKGIAVAWLMLFVLLVGGSLYNRLGRPDVSATSTAEAAINPTDRPLARSSD